MAIEAVVVTEIEVRRTMSISLGPRELHDLLAKAGIEIPANASITIEVPGGDWSNTDLDVEESRPVVITWKETEHKKGGG